jgi:MFS transporter, ACS family, tartrate transporter
VNLERQVMTKVKRRILPLIVILYFVSYVDRMNLGFAGLTMNHDLGFSPEIFGLGGAFFFVGYLVLQVPGTILLHKFGARKLVASITFLWGIFAVAMAFIWDTHSFFAVRFLLGAAEAAFFPGMIYYISLWFPTAHRGRVLTLFLLANPLAGVIGLPLSAMLMKLNGIAGLTGWQWVFVGEGLPAVILGIVAILRMTDRPENASWLTASEKDWLMSAMVADEKARASKHVGVGANRYHAAVLALGYFGIIMGLYGLGLWIPMIVKGFGLSNTQVGFTAALPYLAAALFLLYWGKRLDRHGNHGLHAALACFVGSVGLAASAFSGSPAITMLMLTVAAIGMFAALPAFWIIPTSLFSGTTAAASIGLVSSMGHVGGFAGPYSVGALRSIFHSFTAGLCGLAGAMLCAGFIAWLYRENKLHKVRARDHRVT